MAAYKCKKCSIEYSTLAELLAHNAAHVAAMRAYRYRQELIDKVSVAMVLPYELTERERNLKILGFSQELTRLSDQALEAIWKGFFTT